MNQFFKGLFVLLILTTLILSVGCNSEGAFSNFQPEASEPDAPEPDDSLSFKYLSMEQSQTLVSGQTIIIKIIGHYENGDVEDITDIADLSSLDDDIISVNAESELVGVSQGSALVTITLPESELVLSQRIYVDPIYTNGNAYVEITNQGGIKAWGDPSYGGEIPEEVKEALSSGVESVYANMYSFAALKGNGSVVAWGHPDKGGDLAHASGDLSSGVSSVVGNANSYVALKSDGSVVAWGDPDNGGDLANVSDDLSSGVTSVVGNANSYVALKNDGSVVAWGDPDKGGDLANASGDLSSGVTSVVGNANSYVALKNDGSVVAWGDADKGGDITKGSGGDLSSGALKVFPNANAHAVLKSDGSVVAWGAPREGGDIGSLPSEIVVSVHGDHGAFATINASGGVYAWGAANHGGNLARNNHNGASSVTSGVASLYRTAWSFVALKDNGQLVSWGSTSRYEDVTDVSNPELQNGVLDVECNAHGYACVAFKDDGKVVPWGFYLNPKYGYGPVVDELSSDVKKVFHNSYDGWVALKNDHSIVTWGYPKFGGNPVEGEYGRFKFCGSGMVNKNVLDIIVGGSSFLALLTDGSYAMWGSTVSSNGREDICDFYSVTSE